MTKRHMIDPPSGWKYGFPKEIPDDVENTIAWLLENGYPQHEIDACGDHFYCRHYNEEDELDRLKAIASNAIREQIPLGEEIDRLRAENARLKAANDDERIHFDTLYADYKQLREALKPFAVMELWTDAYPDGPLEATTKERFVDPHWVVAARAALENDND